MSVLAHTAISERFDEIFKSGGDLAKIRAAKYNLTLGEDFLVLPDGRRCPRSRPRSQPFTIKPGESAIVSTKERLVMPADLVGILGSRFDNAEHGVLFFGGMVVDPGYGLTSDDKQIYGSPGEPLTFTIGNVGNKPIELRPGEDEVASIVFHALDHAIGESALLDPRLFRVTKPAKTRIEYMHPDDQKNPPPLPLGFVQEMASVGRAMDKVSASVSQVVLFGVIVLAVALTAAVVGAIFAITVGTEKKVEFAGSFWLGIGSIFAAVVIATSLFYLWTVNLAYRLRVNRKVRLNSHDS